MAKKKAKKPKPFVLKAVFKEASHAKTVSNWPGVVEWDTLSQTVWLASTEWRWLAKMAEHMEVHCGVQRVEIHITYQGPYSQDPACREAT